MINLVLKSFGDVLCNTFGDTSQGIDKFITTRPRKSMTADFEHLTCCYGLTYRLKTKAMASMQKLEQAFCVHFWAKLIIRALSIAKIIRPPLIKISEVIRCQFDKIN